MALSIFITPWKANVSTRPMVAALLWMTAVNIAEAIIARPAFRWTPSMKPTKAGWSLAGPTAEAITLIPKKSSPKPRTICPTREYRSTLEMKSTKPMSTNRRA